jgi:hypothetical protein
LQDRQRETHRLIEAEIKVPVDVVSIELVRAAA